MKTQLFVLSALLVLALIASGLSAIFSYSIYKTYSSDVAQLVEQQDDISENLVALNVQPQNTLIVLAWHEQIDVFELDEQINVSSYDVGYLFYNTEAGSGHALLSIYFKATPANLENVIPSTLYSYAEDVEIGAPRKGVVRFDIQAPLMRIYLYSMETTNYSWIRTSISLYLVD